MPAHGRPNILVLVTDDQRYDTIAALGNPEIRTPHLDRLVREGTAFTNAYIMGGTVPAVCMPSRAMLLTGRTLFGLQDHGETVPRDHVLLGEALRAAGYRTFGTGKWHNGPPAYARSFTAGAEIFFGGMADHWNVPACAFDPTGAYAQRFPQTVDFVRQRVVDRVGDHIHPGRHSSELFADAAADFLKSYDGPAPFFAYVAFMAPHDPRTMPRAYREMYDPARIALPESFRPAHPFDNGELRVRDELLAGFPRRPEEVRAHIADYYAMITHLDAQIGRVLDALEAAGRARDTVVVLAGDNGLAVGRHGLMGKQNLYEHSVRVPLVLRGPGVPAGQRREALCYLLDVFPTLCDLAGLDAPASVQGQSLAPALGDASAHVRERVYLAYRGWQRGLREGERKLIEYMVDGRRTTQLFDLAADPAETRNLAGDPARAEDLARLRRALCRERDLAGDHGAEGQAFWSGFAPGG